ncbi:MAG: class I SAM-dependent methyltransferase [Nanoarchaeota archaeon]|nr:class I SAM-dependent methyltransferase [Nanoarchaeota archaeon]MBU1005162.1 class I SAM-dependent methyltransferase [Nanoarchaeota archaeon]MBU1946374.1 class I SAM-dependent methyltransferase [Nanoarchaeota archaeon]
MSMLDILKTLPIDLGQGGLRKTTKGKLIALSLIKKGNGKTALDAGCREGTQSELLKKKGYKVTSIDIEKNYRDCMIVDLNKKLPFKKESFSLIWCSEVIEHLKNPYFTINEFRRVLKKEGELIITTPNSYCMVFQFMYLFGLTPKKMQRNDHKHFFNKKHIKKIFPKAKIYGFFPYFLIKMKISRAIGLLSPTFVICEKR